MNKLIIVAAILLTSMTSFAHKIDFSITQSPVVIATDLTLKDGRLIKSPWMMPEVSINNYSEHDIDVLDLMVTCSGAAEFYNKTASFNQTVAINSAVALSEYFDLLPTSDSSIYSCTAILTWRGPHHAHHQTFEFQTQ